MFSVLLSGLCCCFHEALVGAAHMKSRESWSLLNFCWFFIFKTLINLSVSDKVCPPDSDEELSVTGQEVSSEITQHHLLLLLLLCPAGPIAAQHPCWPIRGLVGDVMYWAAVWWCWCCWAADLQCEQRRAGASIAAGWVTDPLVHPHTDYFYY